ncbi:hypothetical protein M427DRAFT_63066 [Gonapodya prolifera JEL478]|uniref:Protein OS-9 homolog n=1 Tax=Gonapodya prolifera (strain JEL478) TaxID=1344416 RepID=A0A138ZZW5_GONPJ|nr:hypothetical protein M427DRAFT_63066 [Gonapodya prolifera JEL478]|eukprot:KXS10012.1 hypothetical protein M427DRAFT_63066 [Gonapodya prolifera JEL478]
MEVREALSAVLDMKKKCLQYGQGWFTYEYCHLSHVRQYHKPDLPSVDGAAEFYLGIDQASTVAEKLRRKKLLDGGRSLKKSELRSTAVAEVKVGGDGRKYLSIWYGDGTECDLTGKPRVVEVQFQCPARPHDPPDHITLIQEVSTCSYLLVIHTTRLCHLAPFNPVENSRVESISCAMVVSDGYYELVQAGGGWSDGKSASEIGEGDHAQTAEEGARQGRLTAAESSELFPHLFPTVNRIGSRHKSDWREAEEAKRHRESEPEADDEPAGDGSGLREVKIRGAEPGKRLTLEDVMKIVADQLGVHLGNDNEGDDDAEDSEDAKYVKVEDAEGRDILVRVFNGDGAGEHETMEEGRREKGKKGKKKGDS